MEPYLLRKGYAFFWVSLILLMHLYILGINAKYCLLGKNRMGLLSRIFFSIKIQNELVPLPYSLRNYWAFMQKGLKRIYPFQSEKK
jgi:hypothetical protein